MRLGLQGRQYDKRTQKDEQPYAGPVDPPPRRDHPSRRLVFGRCAIVAALIPLSDGTPLERDDAVNCRRATWAPPAVQRPIRPSDPEARRMSWRDAVPHAGAGLGRGLEYRPRLSAALLIQQSNCNARQARWMARAVFREAR